VRQILCLPLSWVEVLQGRLGIRVVHKQQGEAVVEQSFGGWFPQETLQLLVRGELEERVAEHPATLRSLLKAV